MGKWFLLGILVWCLLSLPVALVVGHVIWRSKNGVFAARDSMEGE